MPFESVFLPSNPGNLHLLSHHNTTGESFFFLHGNSLCAAAYLPLLKKLHSLGYAITAADIRGHGRSTREGTLPLQDWNPFIEDIAHILKVTQQGPVIGVGHSMGAFFLYAAAARFPHLFSRLILLDPVIFPTPHILLFRLTQTLGLKNWFSLPKATRKKRHIFPDRSSAALHYQGKGMFRYWDPDSFEGFLDQGLRPLPNGGLELACAPELEARFYETVPPDTWRHTSAISCPVHIVRAEYSHLFSRNAALRLQKELPIATIHTLAGRGHFFPLEIPDTCADLIAGYHPKSVHPFHA